MKKVIRLDALVSTRDMSVRARSPPPQVVSIIGAVVPSTNYAIVKYNDTLYRSILQFNFAQNIDL